MAFVGDDKAVPGGELRDVVAAGQGLQGDDIDGATQLGPAAAELPGFDAEDLGDPGPPLVCESLPVHQDESGDLMRGDDRARHYGRRRIEDAGLRRTGRLGLPRAQLKHLQQARILRPQTRQFRGYSRGTLSHAHTIRNRGHIAHAGVPGDVAPRTEVIPFWSASGSLLPIALTSTDHRLWS